MLKLILISTIILFIALLGLSIKLLIDKNAKFRAGSCNAKIPGLKNTGLSCGCEAACATEE